MSEFEKGVPFDPGYAPHFAEIAPFYAIYKTEMSKLKAIHQKKFKLSTMEADFTHLINKFIGFYTGCMFWAGYLHFSFQNSPKTILNNHNLNIEMTEAQSEEFLNHLETEKNLIALLDRDYNFYLKKSLKLNKHTTAIMEAYREFVILNEHFVKLSTTSEIKLPESFIELSRINNRNLEEVKAKIDEVVKTGKLEQLMDLF